LRRSVLVRCLVEAGEHASRHTPAQLLRVRFITLEEERDVPLLGIVEQQRVEVGERQIAFGALTRRESDGGGLATASSPLVVQGAGQAQVLRLAPAGIGAECPRQAPV